MPNSSRPPTSGPNLTDYGRYAGVGLQFALTFMLFGALGYWLDETWNTRPWFLIVGVFVGAAGAFVSLVKKFPTSKPRVDRDDGGEDAA